MNVNVDRLGLIVRRVWVDWARKQPNAKLSWLAGWEDLDEPQREVDRLIGEALYVYGYKDGRASERERMGPRTMRTAVIYARVPVALKEAVDLYASQHGKTITGAAVDLLRRGLTAASTPPD
jgi:hypothetical protein